MYLFYQFSSFCQPTLVQNSEKFPKNESFEKMCPPQAVRFDWFLMEYSVFASRTQVLVRLSTHEGHYIFSVICLNTLTQYSRSTANCCFSRKIRNHVA